MVGVGIIKNQSQLLFQAYWDRLGLWGVIYTVDICYTHNTQKELNHGRSADDYSHPPIPPKKNTKNQRSKDLVSSLTKPWFMREPGKGLL